MTTIASRLTAFALISALEMDVRLLIHDVAPSDLDFSQLPADVVETALGRMSRDADSATTASDASLDDVLFYSDFADLAKLLRALVKVDTVSAEDSLIAIAKAIEAQVPARNRVCHSRPLEPDDLSNLYDLAASLQSHKELPPWTETQDALARLNDNPSFVFHLEIPEYWRTEGDRVQHNLPLPDFDETGFLGRKSDRRDVHKLIYGALPVVNIVGLGGLGKSALALRVLYDLIDDPKSPPFEAIIWTSLKTRSLTYSGIREIRDGIEASLKMSKDIAAELGVAEAGQPEATKQDLLKEITSYLREFRVLLAIDNVESVAAEELMAFLSDLPEGTKVLLTSRIGLGELEKRYALRPLDEKHSMALLRKYASVLNVELIAKAPQKTIQKYADRLYNNPLAIKWFVSSVSAGRDPGELLSKKSDALEEVLKFCFENVLGTLDEAQDKIVNTLAAAGRPISKVELNHLLPEIDQDTLNWALVRLTNTSIVRLERAASEANLSSRYLFDEMATKYFKSLGRIDGRYRATVSKKLREIRKTVEKALVDASTYRYDMWAVRPRTWDEKVVSVRIRRALDLSRRGDEQGAVACLEEAAQILPSFSEIPRLAGQITSDVYQALEFFEEAIELDPDSSLAHFCLAYHQLKSMEDPEAALDAIEVACRLDPNDPAPLSIKAMALTRAGRLDEACTIYEGLLSNIGDRPKRWRVPTRDQAAECYRRAAEQQLVLKDFARASEMITRSLAIAQDAVSEGDSDSKSTRRFQKILDNALSIAGRAKRSDLALTVCSWIASNAPRMRRRLQLRNWGLMDGLRDVPVANIQAAEELIYTEHSGHSMSGAHRAVLATDNVPTRHTGKVRRALNGFGFIDGDDGESWFFPFAALSQELKASGIRAGDLVSFRVGRNKQGKCAIDVQPNS